MALFVVVSHITSVTTFTSVNCSTLFDLFRVEVYWLTLGVAFGWRFARVGALVLPNTGSSVLLGEWGCPITELSLGNVDAGV